jgi:alkylhydroperoxidase family enzyme
MPIPRRLEWNELEPALKGALAARVERLGYLGEFFKCMGHQPRALRAFVEFTEASKKGLAFNLIETIALSIATHMGNAYERNQHERLSVRSGLSKDWIRAVQALEPDVQTLLSDDEKRVQELALAVLDNNGHDARAAFEDFAAATTDEIAVAALMVITRYVAHAIIVNTLALAPPVPSIFEDGFNG